MNGKTITNLKVPTMELDAATKLYVDSKLPLVAPATPSDSRITQINTALVRLDAALADINTALTGIDDRFSNFDDRFTFFTVSASTLVISK